MQLLLAPNACSTPSGKVLGDGAASLVCYLRLQCRFVARCAARSLHSTNSAAGMPTFAAKVLGATGPLLSVLAHFFEQGRRVSPRTTSSPRPQATEILRSGGLLPFGCSPARARSWRWPEHGPGYADGEVSDAGLRLAERSLLPWFSVKWKISALC